MFCSKCGKELLDEAVICPGCGCPTINYYRQPASPPSSPECTLPNTGNQSENYVVIQEFSERVKIVYILSIIGIALFWCIGIIFAIISEIVLKNIDTPKISRAYPSEMAKYNSAKRKLSASITMNRFTIWLCVAGIAFPAIIGIIGDIIGSL